VQPEKKLMTIDEFCQYVGIGKTKAREIISNPSCKYVVRIGRRVFIHKELFDEELKKSAKYQLTI
jgi:excisionase family DNA binding protein